MRRTPAAIGSGVFFAVAPGTVAGVLPWWITGWRIRDSLPDALSWAVLPVRLVGVLLIGAGATVLLRTFARFVREGRGTPAPVAPTRHLVVGGLYRHVRNPMYVAIFAALAGQAMFFGRPVLILYAAVVAVPTVVFVHWYEEPTLRRTFGAEYDRYHANVPGWRPSLRPYQP
jgi:protein-S-isoprenylcysteine O-methyltransferase Ste14